MALTAKTKTAAKKPAPKPKKPLGGSAGADSVQRGNWQVYQAILVQL